MFCGKIAISRLLRQPAAARALAVSRRAFSAPQARFMSVKPDLFTLDLDVESGADSPIENKDTQNAGFHENNHERPAEVSDSHTRTETETLGKRVGEAPGTSENADSYASDQAQLDSILADFVFDDGSAESISDDLGVDALLGDLFPEKAGSLLPSKFLFEDDLGEFDFEQFGSQKSDIDRVPETKPGNTAAEEKDLFEKIFATYSQTEDKSASSDKLQKLVLANLQESFSTISTSATQAPLGAPVMEKLTDKEHNVAETKTVEALLSTLEYIESMPTREAVVAFTRETLNQCMSQAMQNRDFYLHKVKGESSKSFLTRHARLSRETRLQSEKTPANPRLNAFTMPVLFNQVLHKVLTTFHDGSLALSLFNLVKQDLNLYTIVCNQRTYNEMLKVHWVFYGKCSLCEIELLVVEMMNNGFAGDKYTFIILKEILTTYYAMKVGNSSYNPGGVPIWSKEDEKRARNLTLKLKVLGKQLERERFFNLDKRSARGHSEAREWGGE